MTLLVLLGFAHATIAMADCLIDRGFLAQVLGVPAPAAEPCASDPGMSSYGPLYENRCTAHCTADLQLSGVQVALVSPVVHEHYLLVLRRDAAAVPRAALIFPPAPAVPPRILLHSFQV